VVLDGTHVFRGDMSSEQDRLSVLDPERRQAVMAQEGIVAECIFPTIGLYVWMLRDAEGGAASCRIYNEWVFDQLHRRSPRFCCAGLVPTWSLDQALREVTFIAELGLGALMLPVVVEPMWNHRRWAPLWELIDRTGLPVVMHQGTGHDMVWHRGPGATVANLIATQSLAPRVATMLATSGILEAHPRTHVVFVEFNTGWLAWTMETADYYDAAFRRYDQFRQSDSASGNPSIYPTLADPPSEYLRRQVHATFQVDATGLRNLDVTGAGALLWGSDFPHEEGTYPRSREVVDQQAAGIDPGTAQRVFRQNAIDVFRFDPAALTPL
jgi:predicted TIM-barrel fold metal-dependent hydrolase